MGSSDSGGAGVVDSRAGSIVWVRRRNGSWWPGKILGPDELSASHLMSPRSGTPVKLLGREDASVDWYNLEKSKRVKTFRCGEFDDCIEKAEASLGLPVKKREKYARREDAILHALELEKQFRVKKYGKVGSSNSLRENSSDSERKILATSSVPLENGNGKLGHHQLYQLVKKVDTSNVLVRNIPLREQKPRDATRPKLRVQNTEASHQTRGLQEFGLRTVPVNGTMYASDDSKRMAINDHANDALVNNPCLENSSESDSRDSIGKGKRLLEGFVGESPSKRHDTHHAVLPDHSLDPDGDFISMYEKEQTADGVHRSMYFPSGALDKYGHQGQMEMSVSRLEVGNSHLQHGTFGEDNTSVSSEETESDSSETHSLERVDAGMMQSDAETCIRVQPSTFDRLEMRGGHESTSSDESDELSLDDRSQFYSQGPNPSGVGVSKWQLKGKRNIRNFSKRAMDRSTHRTYEGRGRSLTQRAPNCSLSYYHEIDYHNDVDFIEDDFNSPTQRFGRNGYLASQASSKRQYFVGHNMIDWEDLAWGRPFRGYWQERGQNGHDVLIDVEVEVQANRQGEHVPWVSLMSRLNGKAIIGHPIQIEALEDGSTDMLVSTSDADRVPPVWRTARRTASFRVPRPHLSSQIDEDEDAENQCIRQSGKVQSKKSVASSSLRKGKLKKSQLRATKKKPPRKGNTSLNQKTKALSSIGYEQKTNDKRRDNDSGYYMDGVIKPVDGGPPAVACIPVKLVFSRLLEAIGRPPSGSVIVKHKEKNPP